MLLWIYIAVFENINTGTPELKNETGQKFEIGIVKRLPIAVIYISVCCITEIVMIFSILPLSFLYILQMELIITMFPLQRLQISVLKLLYDSIFRAQQ